MDINPETYKLLAAEFEKDFNDTIGVYEILRDDLIKVTNLSTSQPELMTWQRQWEQARSGSSPWFRNKRVSPS